jgi:tetratricopeptide (TPR) repeat protein
MYDNATQSMSIESYDTAQRLFQDMLKSPDKDEAHEILARAGLAESLMWQGKFDEANKMFKWVLKKVPSLGDRPEVAGTYDAYSWMAQANGKNEEAYTYAKQALDMRKRVLPAASDKIAESLEHLGEISEQRAMFRDAADYYSQALAIRQQGGDKQSLLCANLTEKLATMQYRIGNAAAAQKLYEESLSEKAQSGAVFETYAPHPAWQTLMFRFAPGAPNVSRTVVAGEPLASITTPGNVTVQATVLPATDFKGTTAFVRVINNGHGPIDFMPKPPTLLQLSPVVKMADVLSSDKIAQQIEKKGKRSASLIRFFQGDATTTVTSTVYNNGGYMRPGFGYTPGWQYYNGNRYRYSGSGNLTTISTQVPDWEARARAEAKAQAAVQKATDAATLIREQKLNPTTINPGEMVQGSVQFDIKDVKDGIFRIPIGNAIFEFPISQN